MIIPLKDVDKRFKGQEISLEGGNEEDIFLVDWAVEEGLIIPDDDMLLHRKADLAINHLIDLGYTFIEI
mgnify:CR=1 FL=1